MWALSPVVYICGFASIAFLISGRKKLEPPSDILIMICGFGLIRMSSYICASSKVCLIKIVYDRIYPPIDNSPVPESFGQFCDGTGFVNVMCQLADVVYNVVFCIYYVVKIRNPLKCTLPSIFSLDQ